MDSLDLKVTVEFTCNNMITEDDLKEFYNGDLMEFIRFMMEDESIISCSSEEKLIKVEILNDRHV